MNYRIATLLVLASVAFFSCKKKDDDDKKENKAPTCEITYPVAGFINDDPLPVTETLKANASDSDGSISKVEFYVDDVKVGEDLSAPYEHVHVYSNAGSYNIKAKATDNDGAETMSATVNHGVGI